MFLIGSKYKECVDCPIEPGLVLVRREIIVMMIIRVKVRVRGQ